MIGITPKNRNLAARFLELTLRPDNGTTNRALVMAGITHRLAHDGVLMRTRHHPFPGHRPGSHFPLSSISRPGAGQ